MDKMFPLQTTLKAILTKWHADFNTDIIVGDIEYDPTMPDSIKFTPAVLSTNRTVLYKAVISYWKYASIGFESIDEFIDRFNAIFNNKVEYYELLYIKDFNNLDGEKYSLDRGINHTGTQKNTGTRGDSGTSGSNIQTQERSAQNSASETSAQITNTREDDFTRTDNLTDEEKMNYSVERALPAHRAELLNQHAIQVAFADEFYNLFMEVL